MAAAALPPEAAGRPIEVWFQDEARVGQQGTLTRIWTRRGSRPRKPRDRRYQWAYLFGAVCPARDVGAALVLPGVSIDAMNLHLDEISAQVAPGAHGLVVCDGAGWHQQGDRLRPPANITLLPLPPYAPELNPVENVWEYLRGNRLSITVWNSYDQIVDACCNAWNALVAETGRIASIATRDWAEVNQ